MHALPWFDERFEGHVGCCDDGGGAAKTLLTATVDLDDEYVRDLVVEAFNRRAAWNVTCLRGQGETVSPEASCSHMHWGEYERIDWERIHQGLQIASSYCVRKGLIRKAHLAYNLRKWNAKYPSGRLAGAVPDTLVMVLDDIDYFEEALSDVYEVRDMADGDQVWIAKPSITNQAVGVCIFDRVSGLRAALQAAPELREWVLQRYIERPLLVKGRKFHVRAYVLCIGCLRCYVFSEMLALFASKPYNTGRCNLEDLDSHLTNTCRLGNNGKTAWQESEAVKLLSELPQELIQSGYSFEEAKKKVEMVQLDVRDIIGCCMDAVSSELTFFTLPNCFELFGFDLLVDEDWKVWLLEANAEPDMKQTGCRLRRLIHDLVEGVLRLVADPFSAEQGMTPDTEHDGGLEGSMGSSEQKRVGEWILVLDKKQQRAELGGSGIRMQ